ncbi:MAG: hypothetical protein ACREH3_03975, partial [Geminicoccales bacterium]
ALSYLASPMWLLLLLLTTLEAIRANPELGLASGSVIPAWPFAEEIDTLGLFLISIGMLLLPKLMGLAIALSTPARRAALGGAGPMIKSAAAEIVFSALLAPILMLRQTRAVVGTLLGGCVAWGAQPRNDAEEGWRAALRAYAGTTLTGAVWALLAWWLTPGLLPWLAPVLLGLVLAIPLAVLSGRSDLGLAARRRGWFLVPAEIRPPRELAWLDARAGNALSDPLVAGTAGAPCASDPPAQGQADLKAALTLVR